MSKKRICANQECLMEFYPKAHNAIYHSAECRRIVTNKRELRKYHEEKATRKEGRPCIECKAVLSIYNVTDICALCRRTPKKRKPCIEY